MEDNLLKEIETEMIEDEKPGNLPEGKPPEKCCVQKDANIGMTGWMDRFEKSKLKPTQAPAINNYKLRSTPKRNQLKPISILDFTSRDLIDTLEMDGKIQKTLTK